MTGTPKNRNIDPNKANTPPVSWRQLHVSPALLFVVLVAEYL